jgi:ADP-L-glycero-D-manno-heptose 6-epimerase
MLLVTGGAGFIGSNVVAGLNEAGRTDLAVCDTLGKDGKWRNLQKHRFADFVPPHDLIRWLDGRKLDCIIHLGAISETTARDGDAVIETNFRFSLRLLDWCTAQHIPFFYASSAATYGDGAQGFSDDDSPAALQRLRPMNLYGWSKHMFDLAVVDRVAKKMALPPQWAGLKFFNVFGPNEYHKGEMMSLIAKRFDEANQTPRVSGLFNVGTGRPSSFRDMITAMFAAMRRAPNIEYIAMPESIRDSYQYFTQASVEKLQHAGYNGGFTPIKEAVKRYVTGFLDQPDRFR